MQSTTATIASRTWFIAARSAHVLSSGQVHGS